MRNNSSETRPSFSSIDRTDLDTRQPSVYLPLELFERILDFCGAVELLQAALANHIFHSLATRFLYRHIEITRPAIGAKCLRTLSKNRANALHVQKFHVHDDTSSNYPLLPGYYRLLHKALRNMDNLVGLSLLLSGPRSFILLGCRFRLRTFSTACHWDADLVKWLETQDDMTSALFCGKFDANAHLTSSALPRLQRVSASPLILAAVVPGRPVDEVELCLGQPWLLHAELVSTVLRILAHSTATLHTLQFITHISEYTEITLDALRSIPMHLPALSSLAMYIVQGALTQDVLEGMVTVFTSFTCLRSLMLLSKHSTDTIHDANATGPMVKKWHSSCPSLETISFPSAVWIRDDKLGWVTLKELERILVEREQAVEAREKGLVGSLVELQYHCL